MGEALCRHDLFELTVDTLTTFEELRNQIRLCMGLSEVTPIHLFSTHRFWKDSCPIEDEMGMYQDLEKPACSFLKNCVLILSNKSYLRTVGDLPDYEPGIKRLFFTACKLGSENKKK